ncbi:hypothetical protein JNUCC0626_42755 [Lentzea sp. JNUCC 0626]|uniref:hypothetical protein n=1 Tax=Lentzea sp. JNUCC 0626 TaxID=3367513 RepID=UPI003749E8EE
MLNVISAWRSPKISHCGLLAVDVASSGQWDSEQFVRLRATLFRALRISFDDSGIPWRACRTNDRGDGMVVVVPQRFPAHRLAYPLLDRLSAQLRHHNRDSRSPLRVRAALHVGTVHIDRYGATGYSKVLLSRLLESAPVRGALANAPEACPVAAIVSNAFYDDVVRNGHPGIERERYAAVDVDVKESRVCGWLHIPGNVSSDAERRLRSV